MKVQKGANQPRRNALGRGLGQLLRSTLQPVELGEPGDDEAATAATKSKQGDGGGTRTNARSKQSRGTVEEIIQGISGDIDLEPEEVSQNLSEKITEGSIGPEGALLSISLDRIVPNPNQPRQTFADSEIDSLSESIKISGVLQPILVRRRKGGEAAGGSFEIVAGERRFRAAKQAGLLRVPAILKQLSDKETLQIGIIENVQRENLNPIEEALAYDRLAKEFDETQEDIAKSVGKDRASVSNALRLLKLPGELQDLLRSGQLTAGHGRALLMLPTEEAQRELAKEILGEKLSVRAAEQLAQTRSAASPKNKLKRKKLPASTKPPTTLELEERIRRALGTKVSLQVDKNYKGELRISIYSRAVLDTLLERIEK